MIETSSDADLSFFEAFAQVVENLGLKPPEIARRANRRIKEIIDAIPDPVDRMLVDIATPRLSRQTVARAIVGDTSVSKETFSRIVLGLNLDPKTYEWLEKLREAEPHVHHSTQQRALIRGGKKNPFPSWFDDEQPV